MVTCRSASGGDEPPPLSTLRRLGIYGLRVVAAAVFCYAGLLKLRNPQVFADNIASFQLLPTLLINPLALALPFFELGTGLWLFGNWKTCTGTFCGLAASVIFLLALVSALARGLPVECGCFGSDAFSSLSPVARLWLAIGRDVPLVGVLTIVYFDACHQKRGRLPSSR